MNTRILTFCSAASLAIIFAAMADEPIKSKKGSPEFERMKSLVGTWRGTADMGQGPTEMTVQYRLIAAGSVLEERVFPGTPHEMVTMYYDKDGTLAMTHYCVLGNRPAMRLKSADAKTIKFDFDKSCGIDPKRESHMHSLTIWFDGPDSIRTSCQAIMDGKPTEHEPVTLKRVSASQTS